MLIVALQLVIYQNSSTSRNGNYERLWGKKKKKFCNIRTMESAKSYFCIVSNVLDIFVRIQRNCYNPPVVGLSLFPFFHNYGCDLMSKM